jgi:hypothetical protein
MTEPSSSPTGKLNWIDLYKSVRGGVVVFVATFGTIVVPQFQKLMESGAFDLTSIVIALKVATVATVMELCRRYLTNYEQ